MKILPEDIPRRAIWMVLLLLAAVCPARCEPPATFDGIGRIEASERDGVSLFLNESYLRALRDVRGVDQWRATEVARTQANIARIGKAALARDAAWMNAARRFTRAYAEEQARLAGLYAKAPSEIVLLPGEQGGWELEDRTLVMTFDDGPDLSSTPRIFAALRARGVPAIFFVLGQRLAAARQAGGVPKYGGFTVGSHSWSHPYLAGMPMDKVARQLDDTAREMKRDGLAARFFRPPYGALRGRELALVEARGMRTILWNIDSQDWSADMQGVRGRITDRVVALALLRRHGVVLCHDVQAATAAELPGMLDTLSRLGFRLTQPYR